jgi:uncharacterized membrane protein
MRLLGPLLAVSIVALGWALLAHARNQVWLLVAAACGVAHLALVRLFFVPTNQALGFLPSQSAGAPVDKVRAVRAWLRWNAIRLVLDVMGLLASVNAVS